MNIEWFENKQFTAKELKAASDIMKREYPNGPKVKTYKPDKQYSFNEIADNIRPTLNEISKSLY